MQNWSDILPQESLEKAKTLSERAMAARNSGVTVYPPQDQIFRALALTPPEKVKVVVVGQDPYHEAGQANGLAFSVNAGITVPPSLRNIFKELSADLGVPIPKSGDLAPWAERGVLLLNTVLTVQDGAANSHKSWGWQEFVLDVFAACTRLPQPVVFLLWGGQAQAFVSKLDFAGCEKKMYYASTHPSPLGARKGTATAPAFLGSRPFSKVNEMLQSMGAEPLNWEL